MRQVFPDEAQIDDPLRLLAGDDRPRRGNRPWVMANMVASVDGAYAVDGRSGGLSGAGDRSMFHALRGVVDVVLVAAGTARDERYRRPAAEDGAVELRTSRGQAPAARLVVVSRSAQLPDDQPFLTGEGPDPLVLHPASADISGLPAGVESRISGDASVDLDVALDDLASDGARWVLCEGGPGLLGQLHEDDLLDELFVTISPHLVGGEQVGMLGHATAVDHPLDLHRLMVDDDGSLLVTYRRRRD